MADLSEGVYIYAIQNLCSYIQNVLKGVITRADHFGPVHFSAGFWA